MKQAARLFASFILIRPVFLTGHALAAAMTNDDVIKLVRSGVGEAIIISAIDSSEPRFDTSARGIVALKTGGVPDRIIERILSKEPSTGNPSPGVSTGAPCRLATTEQFQAIMDGPAQIDLTFRQPDIDEDISAGSTVASFFTLGIAPEKGTVAAHISGAKAVRRIKSRSPVFPDLATGAGESPDDTFALVRFTVKEGDRIVIIGEASSSLFGGYTGRSKFEKDVRIPLRLETLQKGCTYKSELMNVYRGTPATPLTPGEYALLYGNIFYDFGVDP